MPISIGVGAVLRARHKVDVCLNSTQYIDRRQSADTKKALNEVYRRTCMKIVEMGLVFMEELMEYTVRNVLTILRSLPFTGYRLPATGIYNVKTHKSCRFCSFHVLNTFFLGLSHD